MPGVPTAFLVLQPLRIWARAQEFSLEPSFRDKTARAPGRRRQNDRGLHELYLKELADGGFGTQLREAQAKLRDAEAREAQLKVSVKTWEKKAELLGIRNHELEVSARCHVKTRLIEKTT